MSYPELMTTEKAKNHR